MYTRDARRGLRRRGQAPHHARHLRAVLAATTTPTTAAPSRCARKIAEDFDGRLGGVRLHRHADEPRRRLRARRQDRRPAGDVPQRLLHRADVARRHPRDLDPQRAHRRPARSASSSPAPRSARTASSTPPTRSSRRSASTARRARVDDRLRARHRPGDPRPARHADEDVLRLRAVASASRPTRAPARSASACPGALPVVNAQAIHFGLMIGLALGCEIAPRSIFHRKNYFYPDIPKGYQITQYDIPLCLGGQLGDVRLHRVHLEEDAAKLDPRRRVAAASTAPSASVVDFNRGGTPLAEIVTEPDMRSAEQAREWLTLLRVTLRQLGVCDVNMEEGSLRCDANVSIRPAGTRRARHQDRAQEHELVPLPRAGHQRRDRAPDRAARGGRDGESRRRCTSTRARARSRRCAPRRRRTTTATSPSPTSCRWRRPRRCSSAARAALPELPAARAERYERDWACRRTPRGCSRSGAELGDYFEAAAGGGRRRRRRRRWPTGSRTSCVARLGAEADPAASNVTPQALAKLVGLVAGGQRHARRRAPGARPAGRPRAATRPRSSSARASARWAAATSSPRSSRAAIAANPDVAESVRGGNMKAIGAIVGHVMRETKGRADGGEVTRLMREQLGVSTCSARRACSGVRWHRPAAVMRQGRPGMARLIRMDRTGHTTLAEWTADDRGRRRGRRRRLPRRARRAATSRWSATGEGQAEQVRELPLDAELVILRPADRRRVSAAHVGAVAPRDRGRLLAPARRRAPAARARARAGR